MGDSLRRIGGRTGRAALVAMAIVATSVPILHELATAPSAAAAVPDGDTILASPREATLAATLSARTPAYAADGEWVAFVSDAPDLVPNDTNGRPDVFVVRTDGSSLTRVSVPTRATTRPTEADGPSWGGGLNPAVDGLDGGYRGIDWAPPAISADGRFVAFTSLADNLVDMDRDGDVDDDDADIFRKEAPGVEQVYLHDRQSGDTVLVSGNFLESPDDLLTPGRSPSHTPAVASTAGGKIQVVAFTSSATNLFDATGDGSIDINDGNAMAEGGVNQHVFRARFSGLPGPGEIDLVSRVDTADANGGIRYVKPNGDSYSPWISADGESIAFSSDATNLIPDRPALGGDGDYYPYGDDNTEGFTLDEDDAPDVFLWREELGGFFDAGSEPIQFYVTSGATAYERLGVANRHGFPVRFGTASITDGTSVYTLVPGSDSCSGRVIPSDGYCEVWIEWFQGENTGEPGTIELPVVTDAPSTDLVSVAISATGISSGLSSPTTPPEPAPAPYGPDGGVQVASNDSVGTRNVTLVSRVGAGPDRPKAVDLEPSLFVGDFLDDTYGDGDWAYLSFTSDGDYESDIDDNGLDDIYAVEIDLATGNVIDPPTVQSLQLLPSTAQSSGPSRASVVLPYSPDGPAYGRFIAFSSTAGNLVSVPDDAKDGDLLKDEQVFLIDRDNDQSEELDLAPRTMQLLSTCEETACPEEVGTGGPSGTPAASWDFGNGQPAFAFGSQATNLDPPDSNGPDTDVLLGTLEFLNGNNDSPTVVLARLNRAGSSQLTLPTPSISADGRYVAFSSVSADIVVGDTNGVADVFIRDTVAGTTVRITNDGQQFYGASSEPSISADGRYVAFTTEQDLDPSDNDGISGTPPGFTCCFAIGGLAGSGSGSGSSGGSSGGSTVTQAINQTQAAIRDPLAVFRLPTDVYVFDTLASTFTWVSVADDDGSPDSSNGLSFDPSISADGAVVAFTSTSTNLTTASLNLGGRQHVYRRVLADNFPELVTDFTPAVLAVMESANEASISGDGNYIAFTFRVNLGEDPLSTVIRWGDTGTATPTLNLVSLPVNEDAGASSISDDGSRVAFAQLLPDVGLGASSYQTYTRQVVLATFATSVSTTPVHEVVSATNGTTSPGNAGSSAPSISGNGRRVVFHSGATDLAIDDESSDVDLFVRDVVSQTTDLVSVNSAEEKGLTGLSTGAPGATEDSGDGFGDVDRLGNRVAFISDANNFSPLDTNSTVFDVYVRSWSPLLSTDPNPVNFGAVDIPGTGGPLAMTLRNLGFGIAEVVDRTRSGNTSDFGFDPSPAGSCFGGATNRMLGQNETCVVEQATFTPQAGGARAANVTVLASSTGLDPAAPLARLTAGAAAALDLAVPGALVGQGGVTDFSITVTPVNFGGVDLTATSNPQNVTVTNTGTGPITITGRTLGGTNAGDFTLTGTACNNVTLQPGQTCVVGSVTFTPTASGNRTATVTVTTNQAGVTGTGTLSGTGRTPDGQILPNPVDFGNVFLGSASPGRLVQVRNSGQTNMTVTGFTIGGTNAADFTDVEPGVFKCVGVTIAPNTTCDLGIFTFRPGAEGARNGTLTVTTVLGGQLGGPAQFNTAPPARPGPTLRGTLTGTGVRDLPSNPDISVTPNPADFGTVGVGGTSAAITVRVTNTGNRAYAITSRSLGGVNPADFTTADPAAPGCLGANLAPGASCNLSVHTFRPTATGARSAVISVATNTGLVGSATLIGTGGAPALVIEPNPMDFGDVVLPGSSARINAVLRNAGQTAVTIGGIVLGGDHPGDFNRQPAAAGACGGELAAGATCNLGSFGFTPTLVGLRRATLTVENSAGLAVSATLVGAGLPAPIDVGPDVQPVVEVLPAITPTGEAVSVRGTDFPPNSPVILRWSRGIRLDRGLLTDANGSFVTSVMILPRDQIGERQLLAEFGGDGPATDDLLVVLPTAQPRRPTPTALLERSLFRS